MVVTTSQDQVEVIGDIDLVLQIDAIPLGIPLYDFKVGEELAVTGSRDVEVARMVDVVIDRQTFEVDAIAPTFIKIIEPYQ
jgi:hypothetical protein